MRKMELDVGALTTLLRPALPVLLFLVLAPLALLCGSALVCACMLPRMRVARSEKSAEEKLFGAESAAPLAQKLKNFREITTLYYDVSTPFYLQMWGDALHFAPRHGDESWLESMRRHEHYLALRLGLRPGDAVLDVGCGIGGPARSVARFSGAAVTGLNISALQCGLARELNGRYGVPAEGRGSVRIVEGDFTRMPLPDAAFDGAFAVEATCHAPDRTEVFAEAFRVLKPGAKFAIYEWAMTPEFDAANALHAEDKLNIEVGNGIALLGTEAPIVEALQRAGFAVDEVDDKALSSQVEWFLPTKGEFPFTVKSWKNSTVGFVVLFLALWFQHLIGSIDHTVFKGLHAMTRGPIGLVRAAEKGIFTPMLFLLATKPADGKKAPAPVRFAASAEPSAAAAKGGAKARRGSSAVKRS